VLTAALDWAVDVWKCKVINLSMGVTEQRLLREPHKRLELLRANRGRLLQGCPGLRPQPTTIIPLTRSYPASFATPLISVDKNLFADPLQFRVSAPATRSSSRPTARGYLGPFAQEPATSWAAPHLAGIAARILSIRPDLKPFEMKTVLYWLFKSSQPRHCMSS